jgi:hypothetical protein
MVTDENKETNLVAMVAVKASLSNIGNKINRKIKTR